MSKPEHFVHERKHAIARLEFGSLHMPNAKLSQFASNRDLRARTRLGMDDFARRLSLKRPMAVIYIWPPMTLRSRRAPSRTPRRSVLGARQCVRAPLGRCASCPRSRQRS
jgi:hypothetical protein